MKNLYLICLLFFAFSINLSAQDSRQKDEIISARKNEKEKIKNREHCAKLTFQQGISDNRCFELYPTRIIDWGKGFSGGLAKITVDGKAGFINTKGKIVVQPKLKDAGQFSENLAPFETDDGKWGFINTKGEIAIEPMFDWAISFHEGLALVQVGELWGFIDQSGRFIIEPKFSEAGSFSEGLAKAAIFNKNYVWENTNIPNGKNYWGFIDKQGNWAIQPTLDYVFKDFIGGMALVSLRKTVEDDVVSENFYVDKQGNKLWKLNSNIIYPFSDDVLVVKVGEDEEGNDTYSFVDRNGKRMTDKNFSYITAFSEGLALARFDGKYGLINKKGEFVIKPTFQSVRAFSEGLAGAEDDESSDWGFIDKSGKWIIKPQFNWIWEFREGFALVAPNGDRETQEKTGYIDRNGKYIWKPTK